MESMSAKRPIVFASGDVVAPINDNKASLVLRFTDAHDVRPISSIFSGAAKQEMDPEGRVRERAMEEILAPVASRRAFVANDVQSQIRFVALTSEYLSDEQPESNFAELGAVMCNLGGYGLAQTCISALATKQNQSGATQGGVYARVAQDNIKAYKIFSQHLGWDRAGHDESRDELFRLHQPSAHAKKNRVWFHFGEAAQEMARHMLNEIRQTGMLVGRGGQKLKVQLEGLDI